MVQFDKTKLTRDYDLYPLKNKEQLPIEDLQYLYLECNFCYAQIAQIIHKSDSAIIRQCKKYKLEKSNEQKKLSHENYNLEKYGVKNPAQLQSSKEKFKKTCLEKYGCENPRQNKMVIEKVKKTCLERYSVDNAAKSSKVKAKTKMSNIEKYGVAYPQQLDEVKEKQQQTMLNRYGVRFPLQDKQINLKQRETCKKQYGSENPMNCTPLKQKLKEQIQHKYGTDNVAKLPDIRKKMYETQKRNGTFGKSKEEDTVYEFLITKFPNTQRQYCTEIYPYPCDFYIPEIDTYVEYQGFMSHGNEPYDSQNPSHLKIVEDWEQKSQELNFKRKKKDMYRNAIIVWTITDPHKRQLAKAYHLNWIEFFNLREFLNWFNTL